MLLGLLLAGCAGIEKQVSAAALQPPSAVPAQATPVGDCPVTQPEWIKPPEDSAVMNPPEPGYYYVNADRSIWASAWWTGQPDSALHTGKDGNKLGWFRPAGADLEITGRRLDAQPHALEAYIPSGYPTRFQATGLYFPSAGCWEVTARAAGSLLKFVVEVEP